MASNTSKYEKNCKNCNGTRRKEIIQDWKQFIRWLICWHHTSILEHGYGYSVVHCHKCNQTWSSFYE